jgi:hypothetical protein
MLLCASAMDPSRRIEDAVVTERTSSPEAQPLNALTRQPFPSIPVSAGVADARSDWDVGRYVFPPGLS